MKIGTHPVTLLTQVYSAAGWRCYSQSYTTEIARNITKYNRKIGEPPSTSFKNTVILVEQAEYGERAANLSEWLSPVETAGGADVRRALPAPRDKSLFCNMHHCSNPSQFNQYYLYFN